MKIIGLAGQAGAGKDSTYEYIRDTHLQLVKQVVVRVAFADGVKEDIEDALEVETSVLWDKPYPDEIRQLLQWWGTELRRAQDPMYWVNKGMAEAKLQADSEAIHLVVITDVRFGNEAEIIREAGGLVFEVIATTATRQYRLGGNLPPAHTSEEIDFEVDGYIENYFDGQQPIVPKALYDYCGDGHHG